MTTKLYLDTRTKSNAGKTAETEYPIKIAINHKGSSAYIGTGIRVARGCWNAKKGCVVEHPYKARYNLLLDDKKLRVDKAIEELRESGALHGASASAIKEAVEGYWSRKEGGDAPRDAEVAVVLEAYARTKKKARTIGSLLATARKVRAFAPGVRFREVTPAWLEDFDNWLSETSPSANSRAVHHRNIKTAFNHAIDKGLTSAPYPFKKFKIRTQETDDKVLTATELRTLFTAPCTPTQEKYRDIFELMFLLC